MTRMLRRAALAVLALSLAGCAGYRHGHPGGGWGHHGPGGGWGHHGPRGGGDPLNPRVAVVGERIEIDQLVLVFVAPPPPAKPEPVTITWRLPADGAYSFTERGIRFEERAAREFTDCRRNEKNTKEFSCRFLRSVKGAYAYDIVVSDGKTTLTRDPFVINDM